MWQKNGYGAKISRFFLFGRKSNGRKFEEEDWEMEEEEEGEENLRRSALDVLRFMRH